MDLIPVPLLPVFYKIVGLVRDIFPFAGYGPVVGLYPVFDITGEYKVIASENDGYSLIFIGDIVDDDVLDVYDFQQLVNTALSEKEIADSEFFFSDMDSNGVLNVIDCSILERLISGHDVDIPVYLKGDFDLDGVPFTPYDISSIKTAIKNVATLSSQQKYICDINSDNVIDEKDLDLLNEQKPVYYTPAYVTMKDAMTLKTKTANVIILCGQSNAYGASPLTADVKATVGNTDFSNIKIKYNNINSANGTSGWKTYFSNDKFETFKLGIGGQADLWFGPEVGLSYFLATNENRDDVYEFDLDDVGIGGTNEISFDPDAYTPKFWNSDSKILKTAGMIFGLTKLEQTVAAPDERAFHKYNGSSYDLNDAHNIYEMEGSTTYSLPYWMGRYHGMLEG